MDLPLVLVEVSVSNTGGSPLCPGGCGRIYLKWVYLPEKTNGSPHLPGESGCIYLNRLMYLPLVLVEVGVSEPLAPVAEVGRYYKTDGRILNI